MRAIRARTKILGYSLPTARLETTANGRFPLVVGLVYHAVTMVSRKQSYGAPQGAPEVSQWWLLGDGLARHRRVRIGVHLTLGLEGRHVRHLDSAGLGTRHDFKARIEVNHERSQLLQYRQVPG